MKKTIILVAAFITLACSSVCAGPVEEAQIELDKKNHTRIVSKAMELLEQKARKQKEIKNIEKQIKNINGDLDKINSGREDEVTVSYSDNLIQFSTVSHGWVPATN